MPTKMKCRVAAPDDDVQLDIRLESEDVARGAMSKAEPAMLDDAIPCRTFRMYFGQTHYSGVYWSATETGPVIHESRLELSRLMLADFDPDVTHIVAQPFLMRAMVDGVRRRHIPDYFLVTSQGPVVVDVKPRARLDDPKIVDTFAWVRAAVETKGWRFEVASEPRPFCWRTCASSPDTDGDQTPTSAVSYVDSSDGGSTASPTCWVSSISRSVDVR
jgi:hypothetical protein